MIDWEIVFENWPEALFIIDREGGFVSRNKAMSGLEPVLAENIMELLDKPPNMIFSFIHGDEPAAPEFIQATVKLTDGPLYGLTLSALPGAERIMGELRSRAGSDDDPVERLEEVFQKIRTLGHDMCQPLTVIMGQTEIMQMIHSEDEEINRRLSAIISESEKLDEMIRKLSLLIQYRHQD